MLIIDSCFQFLIIVRIVGICVGDCRLVMQRTGVCQRSYCRLWRGFHKG
ncbi:hypothetical protein HanXRQr2_Chr03g0124151 [Helianthus annuus]|uniref:Uncharacterized protein n=1 Tax=Helianthus annuus TaxID=4232 RepID=A0A9K3JIZ6_HELAN|nr:hypothetical protein HanXRQr2_Chr03g0124151 [Helianthus annuus]KAJ0944804.1 hypothetical protein HanPSC8_Chr03g0120881 [Helianthus annuus]